MKIREIAKRLSVSATMVSKALNGKYGQDRDEEALAQKILKYCVDQGHISQSNRDEIQRRVKLQTSSKRFFCLSSYEGLWNYNMLYSCISQNLQPGRVGCAHDGWDM